MFVYCSNKQTSTQNKTKQYCSCVLSLHEMSLPAVSLNFLCNVFCSAAVCIRFVVTLQQLWPSLDCHCMWNMCFLMHSVSCRTACFTPDRATVSGCMNDAHSLSLFPGWGEGSAYSLLTPCLSAAVIGWRNWLVDLPLPFHSAWISFSFLSAPSAHRLLPCQ